MTLAQSTSARQDALISAEKLILFEETLKLLEENLAKQESMCMPSTDQCYSSNIAYHIFVALVKTYSSSPKLVNICALVADWCTSFVRYAYRKLVCPEVRPPPDHEGTKTYTCE